MQGAFALGSNESTHTFNRSSGTSGDPRQLKFATPATQISSVAEIDHSLLSRSITACQSSTFSQNFSEVALLRQTPGSIRPREDCQVLGESALSLRECVCNSDIFSSSALEMQSRQSNAQFSTYAQDVVPEHAQTVSGTAAVELPVKLDPCSMSNLPRSSIEGKIPVPKMRTTWGNSTFASNVGQVLIAEQGIAGFSAAYDPIANYPFDAGFVERAAMSSAFAAADYRCLSRPMSIIQEKDLKKFTLTPTMYRGLAPLPVLVSAHPSPSSMPDTDDDPHCTAMDPALDVSRFDEHLLREDGQSDIQMNVNEGQSVQVCEDASLGHRRWQCVRSPPSGSERLTAESRSGESVVTNPATPRRRKVPHEDEQQSGSMRYSPIAGICSESKLQNFPSKKQKSCPISNATNLRLTTAKEEKKSCIVVNSICAPSAKGTEGRERNCDPPKQDYIHVRARRGQATDSHSLAERVRREKISERMKFLQDLVPGCSKITGKAVMLDEIINYVQALQNQVEFLSMKLASMAPELSSSGGKVVQNNALQGNQTVVSPSGPTFIDIRALDSGSTNAPSGNECSLQTQHALSGDNGVHHSSAPAATYITAISGTGMHCERMFGHESGLVSIQQQMMKTDFYGQAK